ncbi:hypothetical protein GCM10023169_09670 [Georgenia halophila]|uniref:STAS domain-containing protein n=1 Tax=Georgenia halophila TaxID=620889 RepID=A0ABP8KZH1_9MICO
MIEISVSASAATLTVIGDLDLAERSRFPEVTARVAGLRSGRLVVDLCRATFVDSTGAAFLMTLASSTTKSGGSAVLRGAEDKELFVLEVCGALELFQLEKDHRCDDRGEPPA